MDFIAHRYPWEALLPAAVNLLKGLGIIPGTIAAFWLRNLYQKRRQNKAMEGWPVAEGRIHSGKLLHEGRRIWLEVTYSYFVSEYRSGTYVRRIRSEDEGNEIVRTMRDQRLLVHYDSSNPDKSVILDRELEMVTRLAPQLE